MTFLVCESWPVWASWAFWVTLAWLDYSCCTVNGGVEDGAMCVTGFQYGQLCHGCFEIPLRDFGFVRRKRFCVGPNHVKDVTFECH